MLLYELLSANVFGIGFHWANLDFMHICICCIHEFTVYMHNITVFINSHKVTCGCFTYYNFNIMKHSERGQVAGTCECCNEP